ncbi:MAG: alpha-galactosidase [Acidimicrobiales bacterium]
MQTILAASGGNGYGFLVDDEGRLRQAGFGPSIERHVAGLPGTLPASLYPLAYPSYDDEPTCEPALRITHADGVTTTHLHVEHVHTAPGTTTISLVDDNRPVEVTLQFRAEPHGVLRQWVQITNRQRGPVTLHEAAAASPLVANANAHVTHFGGDWASEWTTTTEPLELGIKVLDSKGGVRPHLFRNPFFLLGVDGPVQETTGLVVAGALAWGGNVRFAFERSAHQVVRVWCGHNPFAAEYVVDPGDTFSTPEMVWAWSASGSRPISHRLHRWVRERVVREGAEPRPIVANNWEATGFAFDETRLRDLIDDTAAIGAELFLLDDGWFGTAHRRDDDTAGLGDWTVDERKLPNGLSPLIADAVERGMQFGLWVEPEMVNPRSSLYAEHPEWVVGQPGRRNREERHQLVLDVLQPDVARFVVATIDRLLRDNPEISYLKWDANRMLTDPGSPTLAADRQGNYWVDHTRATWALMATVAERHPDVMLMLCASGGGRVDVGSLRWFHEVWLSDNTDPVDRLRMQWAASHFLPAKVIASHVTHWGDRPVAFACAVAMSARFGFDIDTATLSAAERETCLRAVEVYRRIRPLVQDGELYRLVSPLGGGDDGAGNHGGVTHLAERAALMYTAADSSRAVVFAYQLTESNGADDHSIDTPPLRLAGLDPAATYVVETAELTAGAVDAAAPDAAGTLAADRTAERSTGESLMTDGLAWPLTQATTACIWLLETDVSTSPGQ